MDIMVGILLISSTLIAIIIMLINQLWLSIINNYKDKEKRQNVTANEKIDASTNMALTWTYSALLFTIIAFACIALSTWGGDTWKKLGISSLSVSTSMLVTGVLISLLWVGANFWNDEKSDKPYFLNIEKRLVKYLLIGLPVCFLFFSLCSVFYVNYWLLSGNLAVIIVTVNIFLSALYKKNGRTKSTK
jgi:hypothetical protein